MEQTSNVTLLLNRLLWPERIPVTDAERQLADTRITHARQHALLTDEQAQQRRARLPAATTREDLRLALDGLPGVASAGLFVARRVVTALWLGVTGIQILIWALISVFSRHVVVPWWLWTAAGGAVIAGWLWWATESADRARRSIEREGHDPR